MPAPPGEQRRNLSPSVVTGDNHDDAAAAADAATRHDYSD